MTPARAGGILSAGGRCTSAWPNACPASPVRPIRSSITAFESKAEKSSGSTASALDTAARPPGRSPVARHIAASFSHASARSGVSDTAASSSRRASASFPTPAAASASASRGETADAMACCAVFARDCNATRASTPPQAPITRWRVNAANATPETLLRAAAGHRAAGRIDAAILAYEAALRLRPDLPNSWYNLAMLQRQAGLFEAALASYAEALGRGVEGPEEVHLNRGVIFSDDLGRADLAEEALGEALRIAPDYLPALLNLGNLHEDRGDRAGAAAAYAKARALAPDAATPLARLLGASKLRGREDALAAEARARIADP